MSGGRRVLVTGLAGPWGGRVARALARDELIETIVGVDEHPPLVDVDRAEFVQVGADPEELRQIFAAEGIDTVVHTAVTSDGAAGAGAVRRMRNINGTRVLVDAAVAAGVGHLVLAGSAHVYGCSARDPAYFTEDMVVPGGGTRLQQELRRVEETVAGARRLGPTVSVLRFADVLGPVASGSVPALQQMLLLPGVVPAVAGFDPRVQVLHPDDGVAALEHAVLHRLDGVFNVAGDGVLALSEVASLMGRRVAPVLPPWGVNLAAAPLRRAGMALTDELLALLRHGRAVDNRRLKASGLRLRFTTREAVVALRRSQETDPVLNDWSIV